MLRIEKMIMIGATARQSGKTELASCIIKKFYTTEKITGIKVTTAYEGDISFHGSFALPLNKKFIIEKSTLKENHKSTDRMLAAGATETYWIHSKVEFLNEAMQKLLPMVDEKSFIVCESNSLRKIVEPDIFIMIRNKNSEIKNSVAGILELANFTVEFNGTEIIGFDLNWLDIKNRKWIFKKNN